MMVFRSLYTPMDAARIIVEKLAEYSAITNGGLVQGIGSSLAKKLTIDGKQNST